MLKTDIKDRKILWHLCQNSRQGLSRIAKEVGLSKNSVNYRVERLRKMGVIRRFLPIVNIGAFAWITYDILLKLRAKPEEEKKVFDFLNNCKYSVWVDRLSGDWDIVLEIAVKDIDHYYNILTEIFSQIGDKIDRYETFIPGDIFKVLPMVDEYFSDLEMSSQKT